MCGTEGADFTSKSVLYAHIGTSPPPTPQNGCTGDGDAAAVGAVPTELPVNRKPPAEASSARRGSPPSASPAPSVRANPEARLCSLTTRDASLDDGPETPTASQNSA
jgi:hypothetical protein